MHDVIAAKKMGSEDKIDEWEVDPSISNIDEVNDIHVVENVVRTIDGATILAQDVALHISWLSNVNLRSFLKGFMCCFREAL